MSTVLILAQEEGDNIGLVLPDSYELAAGIIAFTIVFVFVRKWAFPAINRSLENRQQAISGQLKEAEAVKLEAQSLLDDYRAQLATAKGEANRILQEARQEVADLSIDLAEKVVGENLDRAAQHSLIERYLADLERMA